MHLQLICGRASIKVTRFEKSPSPIYAILSSVEISPPAVLDENKAHVLAIKFTTIYRPENNFYFTIIQRKTAVALSCTR